MAKFCGNCGYQSDDSAVVCGNCGTPLEGAAPAAAKASKLDPKMIKIGAIAVAAVVVLVVLILLLAGGGHKGMVKKVFKAVKNDEPSELVDLYPSWELEMSKSSDLKELEKGVIEKLDTYWDEEVGSDYKVSYKITDIDDHTEDDLEELKDSIEKDIEEWEERNDKEIDFDVDEIKAFRNVELDIVVKDGKEKIEYDGSVNLIKEGGKWKLYSYNLGQYNG